MVIALKVRWPSRVVIIRGNHESRQITQVGRLPCTLHTIMMCYVISMHLLLCMTAGGLDMLVSIGWDVLKPSGHGNNTSIAGLWLL